MTLVVLGATGYTGGIIASQLNNNGVSFSIAGRNKTKLELLKGNLSNCENIIETDVFDEQSIDRLLDQADILINCVGPFNHYAPLLLNRIARKNIVYIDITGEQDIVLNSYLNLNDIARNNNSTIIHSCSFESCLADILAAEYLSKEIYYEDISSYYYLPNTAPSPGTKLTMKLSKLVKHFIFRNGRLLETLPMCEKHDVDFADDLKDHVAIFIPYPEVIFFSRQYHTKNVGTYMIVNKSMIQDTSFFSASKKNIESIIQTHEKITYHGPDRFEREKHYFKIIVIATDSGGNESKIYLKGYDPYGLTAAITTTMVESFICGTAGRYGVLSPSEAIEPRKMLEAISRGNKVSIYK